MNELITIAPVGASVTPFIHTLTPLGEAASPCGASPDAVVGPMPDDSMFPEICRGDPVAFDDDLPPESGDVVLLVDGFGQAWIRKYRARPGGRFDAVAINSAAHADLDSVRHGLRVIAVMVGHWRGRRSRRH